MSVRSRARRENGWQPRRIAAGRSGPFVARSWDAAVTGFDPLPGVDHGERLAIHECPDCQMAYHCTGRDQHQHGRCWRASP